MRKRLGARGAPALMAAAFAAVALGPVAGLVGDVRKARLSLIAVRTR